MQNEERPTPQIRLRLSTRDQHIQLDEDAPILVPTTFRRYALSTLVNSLLGNEKTVPLEFLINGSYLRTTLEEYLSSNGISTENILQIEYVRARIPPQHVASFQHEDWVSSVDVLPMTSIVGKLSRDARILSSSYDGYLRIWNTSSQVVATSSGAGQGGHTSAVRDAKFVSSTQIASCGSDRTVRLWKYSEDGDGFSGTVAPQIELLGHTASVESICPHANSHRLLSASADHGVGLWSTRKSDAPAASDALVSRSGMKDGKRRKLNPSFSVTQRGPLALMTQHTQPASGAMFDSQDPSVGYSTSWDQTLRTWDLVTASLVDTRTTSNALLSIEHLPALHLIAAGSAGRDIKLIDPRDSATTVTAMSLRGHRNCVVTLARDPNDDYTLVSGSHDGNCRVWDVRSTKKGKDGVTGQSLYSLGRQISNGAPATATGEGTKVFGVCWDAGVGIVSGGEDKLVQIHSSNTS